MSEDDEWDEQDAQDEGDEDEDVREEDDGDGRMGEWEEKQQPRGGHWLVAGVGVNQGDEVRVMKRQTGDGRDRTRGTRESSGRWTRRRRRQRRRRRAAEDKAGGRRKRATVSGEKAETEQR